MSLELLRKAVSKKMMTGGFGVNKPFPRTMVSLSDSEMEMAVRDPEVKRTAPRSRDHYILQQQPVSIGINWSYSALVDRV